jgi:hypothetical protein
MKSLSKVFFIAVTAIVFTLSANTANAQPSNDAALIGRATGAAHECINAAREPGFEITGQVETTSICIVSGFITTVKFYKTPVCHHEPCPRPIPVLVAEVTFGCDGEVINVTCF